MKIFISRNLDDNSPFKLRLKKEGYRVTGISLLAFVPIPFDPLPKVDWLFFYSKNGVKHYFEQTNHTINQNASIAAMGSSTAKTIEKYGRQAVFIGKGTPIEIASAFRGKVKGQKVAFLRASNSKKSIQTKLQEGTDVIDRIVYSNIPINNCFLPPYEILVFTSPANAQNFFKYNSVYSKKKYTRNAVNHQVKRPSTVNRIESNVLLTTQHIISIGTTTTAMLHDLGVRQVITAPSPTETDLVQVILQLASRISK